MALNLGNIVSAVGQRITMIQARDIAAATQFCILRHDQLYRQFLWKDSVIMLTVDIDTNAADYSPNNYFMPTKGNMVLPPIFQQVLAVRAGHWALNVERPMVYFRIDCDEFKRTGTPFEFFLLPSAVWEFDTQIQTDIVVTTPDEGIVVTVDFQDLDGISVDRDLITCSGPSAPRIPGPFTDVVYGFQKPVTQGVVQLATGIIPATRGLFTMQPTDTDLPKCQRFRFMSIPDKNHTVRVLGKRTTPPFSANSDIPGINGLDAILFALVYYDMCHRDERGGTPEADKAMIEAVGPEFLINGKAGGFLGKLIEEEVVQAAHNTRIMPEFGFGDEYDYSGWRWDKSCV